MFSRHANKLFAAAVVVGLVAASFVFGFSVGHRTPRVSDPHLGLLTEVEEFIESSAIDPRKERELMQGAIKGMVESLDDPYAAYVDAESYQEFKQEYTNGQYSGVGLWLKEDAGDIKIVSVLDRTPASRAGIQSGDVITAVTGRAVSKLSLDEVVQKIQGRPGTQVNLTITRGGGAKQHFTLVREKIEIPSVESRLLRNRVGLVRLVQFSGESGAKVRSAVSSLSGKGAKGFILDLRGNPGGSVPEAVEVASAFLPSGKVVSYKQRGKKEVTYTTRGKQETKLPLVVLVDEGSASASEIVAGAIQDRGRGIILGTKTYGKGSVQQHFELSDRSAVKLTIASYYTPDGRSIGGKGIVPDVEVADPAAQLARAEEVMSGILAEAPKRAG